MKIIEQSHEILHFEGIDRIERAARTCYKSEEKIGCTLKNTSCCVMQFDFGPFRNDSCNCSRTDCPEHSAQRMVHQLIKRGHHAMLEHGYATVRFTTNRGVTHELVRHRLASFGQESTRYCGYGKGKFGEDLVFIRPVWDMTREQEEEFYSSLLNDEKAYKALISKGWKPEQAREVLPNAIKTEIVMTCNFREWRHVLKLRELGTTGRPHPQMHALMSPVLEEFKRLVPAVFDDLVSNHGQDLS